MWYSQDAEASDGQPKQLKPYTRPDILYELELETRAGSPLGLPDPLDLIQEDEY
jgi:hypothetical protein